MSSAVINDDKLPASLVLRPLFDALHHAGIRYCGWRNSEHFAASLHDIDVLCDRQASTRVARILQECNFKRVVVEHGPGSPSLAEYVGFDDTTGALTRLRVRYQLTVGDWFRTAQRVPWEEVYLTTRVFDERHRLYVADPHLELIALLMRQAMAMRWYHLAVAAAGEAAFRNGMPGEFRRLAARVEPQCVVALATRLMGERIASLFPAMLASRTPSTAQLFTLRRRAATSLSGSRGDRRLAAAAGRRWWREIRFGWRKLRNWFRSAPDATLPTLPHGGITIAVLGADGAGKSTVVSELARWLSRHVTVTRTYGGSGKGSAGLPRRVMQGLAAWRRRVLRRNREVAPRPVPIAVGRPSGARAMWVLALARERRRRALEVRRARARGAIVLSDRLAQSQYPGMNDGPRLSAWLHSRSPWRRWAAERERAAFRLCEEVCPDLVIKLHVPPEVALSRKPETPRQQVLQGIDLLRNLRWPAPTKVLDLDATQPLDHVLLQAKRAVWEMM